jgi:hypothetical protein
MRENGFMDLIEKALVCRDFQTYRGNPNVEVQVSLNLFVGTFLDELHQKRASAVGGDHSQVSTIKHLIGSAQRMEADVIVYHAGNHE